MNDYIAWLNETSVARGTLAHVERIAREIAATPRWQEAESHRGPTTMRITRGARQMFVKSVVLTNGSAT